MFRCNGTQRSVYLYSIRIPPELTCLPGGHLKPDSYAGIATLAQRHGVKAAAEVADFESANLAAVTEFIRQEKIDCDFIVTRAVDVQFSEKHQSRLREGYESLVEAGVESTKTTFCAPDHYAEQVCIDWTAEDKSPGMQTGIC